MSVQTEHGRLLQKAAQAALKPLGCFQKGRSRTWIDDQGYWAIVIEFQPSGFSRGSYLNVGACWLWYEKDHWSFDHGYRRGAFVEFVSAEGFAAAAQSLAHRAAQEVQTFRHTFSDLTKVAAELCNSPAAGWPTYHAAVAAGLVGDVEKAKSLFTALNSQLVGLDHRQDWERERSSRASALAEQALNTQAFRSAIADAVLRTRLALKLPLKDSSDILALWS